jgi:pilus assembly protein CpaE
VIVIVEPEATLRERLLEFIPRSDEVVQATGIAEAEATLYRGRATANIALLGPGLPAEQALAFAEKLETERGGVATLLVAHTLHAEFLREALRSGVADVLTVGATAEEWAEAMARARARSAVEQELAHTDTPTGRIVSVFATKGGTGKTLVAVNLAVIAAQQSKKPIALVDLDLQSGDVGIMLQLMPAFTIHDAAQDSERLDEEAIRGFLTLHRTGVSVLAAPLEPSMADQVSAESITEILELLAMMFPLVVVDGPPMFTEQMLAALDRSDETVLVGSMDVPSIKNLRQAISTLNQLGHPLESLRVVLNRSDSRVGLRVHEIEKTLGVQIDVEIPSSRDVPLSINQGTPLAASKPRSPVTHALGELATLIAPDLLASGRGRRFKRH